MFVSFTINFQLCRIHCNPCSILSPAGIDSRVLIIHRGYDQYAGLSAKHSGGETGQTSSPSYITSNNKTGGDKENKNGVKIEISRNNTLYYSALPGTRNSWTLFDIRRGATKKRLEVIGLRLIIVDTIPGDFFLIILFFANTEWRMV